MTSASYFYKMKISNRSKSQLRSQKAMLEYTVTYVPVQYQKGQEEGAIFKRKVLNTDPDPASLVNDLNFDRLVRQMGKDGWELVSVQPLLKGEFDRNSNVNTSYGLGISLTAGYYFFWKRLLSELEASK
jgi:hypothetical protein